MSFSDRTYMDQEDHNSANYGDEETRIAVKVAEIGTVAYTVGLANRQYGGPEEGGWWYDTFDPRRVFVVPTRTKRGGYRAVQVKAKLQAKCDRMNKDEGRRPPSFMGCYGYWVVYPGVITEYEPAERPYYS